MRIVKDTSPRILSHFNWWPAHDLQRGVHFRVHFRVIHRGRHGVDMGSTWGRQGDPKMGHFWGPVLDPLLTHILSMRIVKDTSPCILSHFNWWPAHDLQKGVPF